MASPEVCKALPMMTWSNSAGSTRLRSMAARAARAPSSIAEGARSAPPERPLGVRAPARRTMSRGSIVGPGLADNHRIAFLAGFLERDFGAVDDVGDDVERVVIGPHGGFAHPGAEGALVLALRH